MNYYKLTDAILKEGGITYNTYYGEIKSGYAVSLGGFEEQIPVKEFDQNELRNYVTLYATELADNNRNLGAWVENEIVYLDISVVLSSKQKAEPLARKNKQIAYFDIDNKKTIYL